MKPFNLTEALAGKPVVTRDGRPVTNLIIFSNVETIQYTKHTFCLVGIMGGQIKVWTDEGRFAVYNNTHEADLFMKSTPRTGWVNVYRNETVSLVIKDSKEAADKAATMSLGTVNAKIDPNRIAAVKIEWED